MTINTIEGLLVVIIMVSQSAVIGLLVCWLVLTKRQSRQNPNRKEKNGNIASEKISPDRIITKGYTKEW